MPLFGCCALFEHNSNDCGERGKKRKNSPSDDPQRFGGFFTRCRRLRKKNFSACDIGKNSEKKLSLSLLQTVAERISPLFAPRIFCPILLPHSHKRARVRKVTFWGGSRERRRRYFWVQKCLLPIPPLLALCPSLTHCPQRERGENFFSVCSQQVSKDVNQCHTNSSQLFGGLGRRRLRVLMPHNIKGKGEGRKAVGAEKKRSS